MGQKTQSGSLGVENSKEIDEINSAFEESDSKDVMAKPAVSEDNATLDIKKASEIIKTKLGEALDKKANATISIRKEGNEWKADVEVVEEEYLPGQNLRSMNDLLGLYDVSMDDKGNLTGWVKKKMYKRSQGL
jgi:hypothetical protein